jgi:hypothetical protein
MIGLALSAMRRSVCELFLLGSVPARRNSLNTSDPRGNLEAARRRMKAARRLRGDGQTLCAVVLSRESLFVLAQSVVGDATVLGQKDRMDHLMEALARAGLEPPSELERQRALLSSEGPCSVDRLGPGELELAADDLEACVECLSQWVQPPSAAELKMQRGLRFGAVGLVLLAILGWIGARLARPVNLARNRPVHASSEAFSTSAEGAVDGIRYGAQLGFHSGEQDEPWLSIDLGREVTIARVAAYGRGDCCFDQSIPLAFEVADDGTTYRPVAQRGEPFSQPNPWIIEARDLKARFVRFRTLRRSFLVLSEVEVYGR